MSYIIAVLLLTIFLPYTSAYANALVDDKTYQSLYFAGAISSNRLETDSYSDKSHKKNIGLLLGYRFSKYIALEGNIENIGDYKQENDTEYASLNGEYRAFNVSSLNANLVGLLPVSDNTEVIGTIGLGVYFQSSELNTNSSDGIDSTVISTSAEIEDHDIGFGQKLGIGFQYRPISSISIRFTQNLHFTMVSNIDNDENRLKQIVSSNLAIKYHFF